MRGALNVVSFHGNSRVWKALLAFSVPVVCNTHNWPGLMCRRSAITTSHHHTSIKPTCHNNAVGSDAQFVRRLRHTSSPLIPLPPLHTHIKVTDWQAGVWWLLSLISSWCFFFSQNHLFPDCDACSLRYHTTCNNIQFSLFFLLQKG